MNQLKWRHFHRDIILLNVRWYLAYPLSYRNLEEMMLDRGIHIDHTTLFRWVQAYSKSLATNFNKRKRPVSKSWRMDETYIKVGGVWRYLYRAVDKQGMTVDFLIRVDQMLQGLLFATRYQVPTLRFANANI